MSEAPTQAPRRSTRERQQTDFLRGNPCPTHSKRRATPVFTPTPTPPPADEMSSTSTTRPAAAASTSATRITETTRPTKRTGPITGKRIVYSQPAPEEEPEGERPTSPSVAPTAPAGASASTAGWRVVDPTVEELITAFPPDMFNPTATTRAASKDKEVAGNNDDEQAPRGSHRVPIAALGRDRQCTPFDALRGDRHRRKDYSSDSEMSVDDHPMAQV